MSREESESSRDFGIIKIYQRDSVDILFGNALVRADVNDIDAFHSLLVEMVDCSSDHPLGHKSFAEADLICNEKPFYWVR